VTPCSSQFVAVTSCVVVTCIWREELTTADFLFLSVRAAENIGFTKNQKAPKGADGHRRQRTVAYLQSQSQASSRRQRGDKTQRSFRQFLELQKLRDLDLDLDLGRGQSHISKHNIRVLPVCPTM